MASPDRIAREAVLGPEDSLAPAAAILAVSEDVYACLALHLESLDDRIILDVPKLIEADAPHSVGSTCLQHRWRP